MPEVAARAIAFYLPQFHPIPENNNWWGPGFTEWTNVARARRLFPGHHQPDLPSELGFYDLRMAESRCAQAELARRYHVEAFCYWHYWFGGGQRILERPFQEVLHSGSPSISFCLAWANESWTGVWHGARDRVLVEQRYPGPEDDVNHFECILPALRDQRYLRVDGKPLFYVFSPQGLPNAAEFVDRWQHMAIRAGLGGLYLAAQVSNLFGKDRPTYTRAGADGFDSAVYIQLPTNVTRWTWSRMRLQRKLLRFPGVLPYSDVPLATPDVDDPAVYQPTVFPNWDNTPRAGRRGIVLAGASPERFRVHVRSAVAELQERPQEERLLWIKSWNEWAEGNHLEPDLRYGRGWLEVLAEELEFPKVRRSHDGLEESRVG